MQENQSQLAGKLLILAMLAAGVGLAGFSWWYRYEATHQAAKYWGPVAAKLIRDAPSAEALRLEPADVNSPGTGVLAIGGQDYQVAQRSEVASAPGMTHLRNALLEDRSFDWQRAPADEPEWRLALRFEGAAQQSGVVVVFAADCDWTRLFATDGPQSKAVSCQPIATGLREVFGELLP